MKIEYRVKAAPRFYVTRYHEADNGAAGVDVKGAYDNSDVAHEVAYALCKAEHDKLGLAPDDERIIYPAMPPSSGPDIMG